jgi:gluconate 5-dehydrogenase
MPGNDSRVAGVHVRELFDLTGRVAIVTGGGSGIGRQLAAALAELGADLVLCARKEERCRVVADELAAEHGIRAIGMRCDVADRAEVDGVMGRTLAELGRLDILVNNAGASWGAPAVDYPIDGWSKVINVNLTGTFLMSQAAGRVMIEQGSGGKIVNISSITAFAGEDPAVMDAVAYSASKGGVIAFTIDLAVKWARHGINVNAICPGWFPTEMSKALVEQRGEALLASIPLGRFGGDDDLKGTVALLASRASDFMTGSVVVVDGGKLAI